MNKILLIDKPADWTSFDVVAKVRSKARKICGNKKIKVGHAGTLDPFATGLLIVLIGSETKNQDKYMKQDKEYEAVLKLGFTSTTGDPEGTITPYRDSERGEESRPGSFVPTQDDVERVLNSFIGEITQIPPKYSAIKVDGKRAYKLAREGKEVSLNPRQVVIYSLEQINDYPDKSELKLLVKCSSGTYIRTLAEDIGKALGTGAYLTRLRRTKIGGYDVKDSQTIDEAICLLETLEKTS